MIATALDHLVAPPSSRLLGWHLIDARPGDGWVRIGFDGKKDFCNPAGFVQAQGRVGWRDWLLGRPDLEGYDREKVTFVYQSSQSASLRLIPHGH